MAASTRKQRSHNMFSSRIAVLGTLFFLVTLFSESHADINCTYGGRDFSPLDHKIWNVQSDDGNVTYELSLCRSVRNIGCHTLTSVCATMKNGTVLSIGNFTAGGLTSKANEGSGDLWLLAAGDRCLELPGENMTVAINFKCGPTLGFPRYINYVSCVTYFEWESSVYCKDVPVPKEEVQCSLYGQDQKRYDLSPLALQKGGYLVDSKDGRDLYINVCRDITPGTDSSMNCLSGSGACKVYQGQGTNMGSPKEQLKETTDGRLMLHYTTTNPVLTQGCTVPPSTTITFKCPTRGGSEDPKLITDYNCEVVIEWQTEYACPVTKLTNDSCILTEEDADIAIDLTPLTKSEGADHPYEVHVNDSYDSYNYFLNVCNGLGIQCPDEEHKANVPACQLKSNDDNFGKRLGSTNHSTLRYADRLLTLTYKGGDLCHHNNAQRSTIINFQCNESAVNDGRGVPVFDRADDDFCIYFFNWQTKYACLENPSLEDCRVDYKHQRYDLSSLVRNSGANWEAIHEITDVGGGTGKYYINICHNVLTDGEASGCDPRSSLCYKEGKMIRNLGRYNSKPTYNPETKEVTLVYQNGDACGTGTGNKRIQSTIRLSCKPGNAETAPHLISVSPDHCQYEFAWQTSSACVLGHYTGQDCKVFDTEAGFSFDLSPLKKDDGYTVTNDDTYNFLLNVCGPVQCTGSSLQNPGICQMTKNSSDSSSNHVTGQWSDTLGYFDGMINLTYAGGDPYNDAEHTPRHSEIAFLCDPSAGVGSPQYLKEEKQAYVFEWYTAYACPNKPVECAVMDTKTHQQYDLSSLAQSSGTGNWNVQGTRETGSKTKYYINVCRPLNPVHVGSGCSGFAAVCRTKFDNDQEVIDIGNMGGLQSGLEVEGEGRLKLTYVSPPTCNNGTHNVSYVTHIEFICEKNAEVNSGPSTPRKDGPCEYTVLWLTPSACPLSEAIDQSEGCTVKDPNSDYVYNLQPFKRQGDDVYTVSGQPLMNATFKLNICGGVPATVCDKLDGGSKQAAVCLIHADGSKTSIGEVNTNLTFSNLGEKSLIYDGPRQSNGERTSVHIDFRCALEYDLGEPRYVGLYQNAYYFEVLTALVCPPQPVNCFVQDKKGNQYNLNSLTRSNYWNVTDTRDGHTDLRYFINVCQPVNQVPGGCSTGPIGSCQKSSRGSSFNLGYIHSKPIAHDDGTVTLHYRNGDVCHKDTDRQAHRSTRINFYCSQVEGGPVFEAETETCEYIFNWNTPAACPVQSSVGSNCTVTDPLYHYTFDLNPLKQTERSYEVTMGEYKYLINVCDPLHGTETCSGAADVASCQTKPGNDGFPPVNAGMTNSTLIFSQGEITLTYSGGQDNCHGKYQRQTIITFKCTHGKIGREPPIFLEETPNCQYRFLWETMYACPPVRIGACSVTDPAGNSYDLSSLSLKNSYYETTDQIKKQKFLFNVCTSVVYGKGALCPNGAAACMVDLNDMNERTKYHNVGLPNAHQVQYVNNRLVIYYDHGEPCLNGTGNVTTHIIMECNHEAYDTSPTGHYMVGNCTHNFLWSTHAACPVSDHTTPVPSTNDTCTLVSPKTGYEFNLSPLKSLTSKPWNVTDGNGHVYEFNVCAPVQGSSCDGKSSLMGVCQSETSGEKRTFNSGNSNAKLQYDDGTIFLNYTGGDRCHGDKFERSTIISFVCDETAGNGHPVFIDETDDCTYYIAWHTSVVCEEHIKCTVDADNGMTLDLSSLSHSAANLVESSDSSEQIYLSVCRPLTPVQGRLCPPGSSACGVKTGSKPISLGKLHNSPKYKSGSVILQYDNGSQCDVDTSKQFSSSITFKCQTGVGEGIPKLIDKVGCHYLFEWVTDVTCYQPVVTPSPNFCGYYDPQKGSSVNLTVLRATEPYQVTNDKLGKTYLVNPCGPANPKSSSACSHAMVCEKSESTEISYGEPQNYLVVKEENMMKMMYNGSPDKCADGNLAQSHIMLECDYSAGIGKPEFFYEMDCYVVFKWKTSVICPRRKCAIFNNGHLYNLNLLARSSGAWEAKDAEGNIYWLNVCEAIHSGPGSRGSCANSAGACRQGKNGQTDIIGTAKSQSLEMHGETIELEYRQGAPVCSTSRRRSNSVAAKTTIRFICGKTVGGPIFKASLKSGAGDCEFQFLWKTKLACHVENEVVKDDKGIIHDDRSGGEINLSLFNALSNDKKQTTPLHDGTVYKISLDGKSSDCAGAAVCAVTGKTKTQTLGTYISRKYSLEDDTLEVEYQTSEPCPGLTDKVRSIIQFQCSTENTTHPPELIQNYQDCVYIFNWETELACIRPHVEVEPVSPSDNSGTTSGSKRTGGMKGKTVAAIVSVFMVAIIICILLVVFHKADRRGAFMSRVRRLVGHKSSEYTQLPTDTDELGFGEEDILNFNDPAEQEQNREDQAINVEVAPKSYHDDSDEDMLA